MDSGSLSQGVQRPVLLEAAHFFRPSNKFENVLIFILTLLVCPFYVVSEPSEKFSVPFFFRLGMGTFPLNQNVDNLHKHGELFPFLNYWSSYSESQRWHSVNFGFGHKNEKNASSGRKTIQGGTELGRKWWQFRREKDKSRGMKIWIASQETLYEVRQRKETE